MGYVPGITGKDITPDPAATEAPAKAARRGTRTQAARPRQAAGQ